MYRLTPLLFLLACQSDLTTVVEGTVPDDGAWTADRRVVISELNPTSGETERLSVATPWPDGGFSAMVANYDGWLVAEYMHGEELEGMAVMPPATRTQRDALRIDDETTLEAGLWFGMGEPTADSLAFVRRWVGPIDQPMPALPSMAQDYKRAFKHSSKARGADDTLVDLARLDGLTGASLRTDNQPMPLQAWTLYVEAGSATQVLATLVDEQTAGQGLMDDLEALRAELAAAEDSAALSRAVDHWHSDTRATLTNALTNEVDDPRLLDTAFTLADLNRQATLDVLTDPGRRDFEVMVTHEQNRLGEELDLVVEPFDRPDVVRDTLIVWSTALAL
ncbi:MAG: hypothetical protein EP330_08120 [Deltaproteobacteria bacterium]|nr:MAG: hypothetical protein EP330_08120 [Deltaproteobacteria bacterium]